MNMIIQTDENILNQSEEDNEKNTIKQTLEAFLEDGGKIEVHPGKDKGKPYIEFKKEKL